MEAPEKVLVLGGTGHFGTRISKRLAKQSGIELIVTSRDDCTARALVNELSSAGTEAQVSAIVVDQESQSFDADLKAIAPFAVIHTAGPYQGQDYRVARACIASGSHYIDLADGREFVGSFTTLDAAARAAGVTLVSGASTLPGLSSAVVEEFRAKFRQIHEIEISIAPAHRTPRGPGTVAAVLSYCGKSFDTLVNGSWQKTHGWQNLRWQQYPALGRRLSGACDVPDLVLLPEFVPGVQTVSFHAALEAWWEQLSLWLMAWLTRLGIVSDWSRYSRGFARWSQNFIGLGSDRGGMKICIRGDDSAGQQIVVNWHLTALENHGPEIPCTPSIVVLMKLLRGELGQPGAMPCLGLFTVAEFMHELSDYSVSTMVERY